MKNERGIAILEFAYTAPILITFIIAIVDLGRALNFHMHLTRLSYEAARYASALPGLEPTICNTQLEPINCPALHALVVARIPPLLVGTPIALGRTNVRSALYRDGVNPFPDSTVPSQNDIVEVVVTSQFDPVFLRFDFLRQLSARTVGPHVQLGG